jgi:imidazolonepropionase-like amidohydrolase
VQNQVPGQPTPIRRGANLWNEALRPEYNSSGDFLYDAKVVEDWRRQGFGAVLSFRADGISRGTGVLAALTDLREHEGILVPRAANYLSFRKGSSNQGYPSSLMGCIALLRQTYIDAVWYASGGSIQERNLGLEAWNAAVGLPQIFEASDKLDVLRIHRLGLEFGVKYMVKTGGDDYQRLEAIKATGQPLIVPVNFQEAYDVKDPFEAEQVSLAALKHWELAPTNPGKLSKAGIPFVLTAADLKDKSKFLDQVRRAVEYGLSEEEALKALTWQPAQLVGAEALLGSLAPGKLANFNIATGSIFKSDTRIVQNWTLGRPLYLKDPADNLPERVFGSYQIQTGDGGSFKMIFKGSPERPEVSIYLNGDTTRAIKAGLQYDNGVYSLSFNADTTGKVLVRLSGTYFGGKLSGRGQNGRGEWMDWVAVQEVSKLDAARVKQEDGGLPVDLGVVTYPFGAYGFEQVPGKQDFLIRRATVWTSEREGILADMDVMVRDGKIHRIGKRLQPLSGMLEIDGSGKHLTAGIIDEHSHIAVSRSINEGGQESTAEVRIGDALDSEDIDVYRQLAGGVTSSHLLHGSANPIGGQTQLIKLRWGLLPEELKFTNWPGFIKFALGENVKQSNYGDGRRYPRTRMGVEQTFMDYFNRARVYGAEQKSGKPYRRDLELEALFEILESRRFITCHSYVQSEITMMLRVAEQFGFRLNTFTHILEGYKVAEKMARHGAGASSFSDWWAYKYEVIDAIPQNPALLSSRGIVVAINSDDAEMARRLNQEAAKSVQHGGMTEEEAWKMVTLNPAKLLRVDDRVGSIRVGKEADLVLWSANPLSVYARVQKTWVDGTLYFDRERDLQLQELVRKERNRLIQKMLQSKKGSEGGERPVGTRRHYHCDSDEDEG